MDSDALPRQPTGQARYWIATIPEADWEPRLEPGIKWTKGQLECGDSGYRHWQFVFSFAAKKTLQQVRRILPERGHYEPTRSSAADDYVCKLATRIGEPFEFGSKSFSRNSKTDWDRVRLLASTGALQDIPSDVYVRYYSQLTKIRYDSLQPSAIVRKCVVYWGPTGIGKSRRAWDEAGSEAYSKDPRTKFWCGYSGQRHVIIDEFRGAIDISHLLRWLDRYPVRVETKGSSQPLMAEAFWITSNLPPNLWYPDLDEETRLALERRMEVINL